jgi:hypothetical protein
MLSDLIPLGFFFFFFVDMCQKLSSTTFSCSGLFQVLLYERFYTFITMNAPGRGCSKPWLSLTTG